MIEGGESAASDESTGLVPSIEAPPAPVAEPVTALTVPAALPDLAEYVETFGLAEVMQYLMDSIGVQKVLDGVSKHPKLTIPARLYLLATAPVKGIALPKEPGPQIEVCFYNPRTFPKPVLCVLGKMPGEAGGQGLWQFRGHFRVHDERMMWPAGQIGASVFEPNAYVVCNAHYELGSRFGTRLPLPVPLFPKPEATKAKPQAAAAGGEDQSQETYRVLKNLGMEDPQIRDIMAAKGMTFPEGKGASGGGGGGLDFAITAPPSPAGARAPAKPKAAPKPIEPEEDVDPNAAPWEAAEATESSLPNGWSWAAPGRVAQGPNNVWCTFFPSAIHLQGLTCDNPEDANLGDEGKVHGWTAYLPALGEARGRLFITAAKTVAQAIKAVETAGAESVTPDEVITG